MNTSFPFLPNPVALSSSEANLRQIESLFHLFLPVGCPHSPLFDPLVGFVTSIGLLTLHQPNLHHIHPYCHFDCIYLCHWICVFLIASCILVDAPQIRSNSPLSILRFCCDSRMPVSFTDQPRPGTDISDRTRCPPFTVHRPPLLRYPPSRWQKLSLFIHSP